jgi:dipeptide/tripeptide permease
MRTICVCETPQYLEILAEAYCRYYGLSGPFQNYMANSWHDPNGLPGALGTKLLASGESNEANATLFSGLSQAGATAMSNYFQFWCYLTPIIGR